MKVNQRGIGTGAAVGIILVVAVVAVAAGYLLAKQGPGAGEENVTSYPTITAVAEADYEDIKIMVTSGEIPAGDWAYSVSETAAVYSWTTGTEKLDAQYVRIAANQSDDNYYVSLKHVPSGYIYFSDTRVETTGARLIIASADGTVYDYDSSAARENYKNGVVSITVALQAGSERIRSIGDPVYGGTTITVSNQTTDFSASVSLPDNTNLWGSQITAVNTVPISAWGSGATDMVKMTVVMTPDTQGRLSAGGLISITLAPYGVADAHDQTVTGDRMADAMMWDELQTDNVTITGRDPLSLTGYDGAYLMGSSWAE